MLYFGLVNDYHKLTVVNYEEQTYRIPELHEFFNDIESIEVCSPVHVFRETPLSSIILSSMSGMLFWYDTQWKFCWLEQGSFDTNIEQLIELLKRGLLRIKI
jgi:hypothetical protein